MQQPDGATREEQQTLFRQVAAEVAAANIDSRALFGAVNALYVYRTNEQQGNNPLECIAATYIAGVQHGLAVTRDWLDASIIQPTPLDDVQVVYESIHASDEEPEVGIGFMRSDGKWYLTGAEVEIRVLYWQPKPMLPAHLCKTKLTTH